MRDWPYFTNEATNLDAAALLLAAIGDPASVSRDPRALNKVWDNVANGWWMATTSPSSDGSMRLTLS